METSLHYGLQQKQLCFLLKERVTTEPNVQLRFRGLLNTVTGGFEYRASLQKLVQSGPLVKGAGTTPWTAGGGVAISSATSDEPVLTATAKKKIALLEGPDTLLHARASVDLDPRGKRLQRRARVAISRRFLNFTERQDLQLKAGVEVDWPTGGRTTGGGGKPKPNVFLSARENNWRLRYRDGGFQVTYDL